MDEIYNIQKGVAPGGPDWWAIGTALFGTLFSTFATVAIAYFTLRKAFQEYKRQGTEFERQGKEKRAQQFLDIRKSYRENAEFQRVLDHLYSDKDYKDISSRVRFEFMGFFEDMAFLANSGLINKELAFYMFGADAIEAWHDTKFWSIELQKDKHWTLLKAFVLDAKAYKEGEASLSIASVVL